VDIDATVLRALKERGAREGKSMGALMSELLATALEREAEPRARPFTWTTRAMGARIDLEDKEAVRRALEAP